MALILTADETLSTQTHTNSFYGQQSRAEQNSTAAPGVETPNLTPIASSISPNDNEDEK